MGHSEDDAVYKIIHEWNALAESAENFGID